MCPLTPPIPLLAGRGTVRSTWRSARLGYPSYRCPRRSLFPSIYASKILTHQDSYCVEYLKAYREKKILV
ncbi:MAG: hypothetical protein A2156_08850 [Deltaproteobacteria bacterium RBG_16_48_10]|nr:MAG: hypothetical protein A2156_08850 [Deltaproteobacteria bacterium RBG_16_48_10]